MWTREDNYIKRLKKGKEDALEFIVDKYLPLVKGITYKVLFNVGNEGDIEECINDVFIAVWNNSNKFIGNDLEFKKWIGTIAKFKAIDYYRKLNRNKDIVLEELVDKKDSIDIEDEFLLNEHKKDILKIIDNLDELDREIIILKFYLGFKSEDIGKRLGLTKASVDNRVYRSKKKLKEIYKKKVEAI